MGDFGFVCNDAAYALARAYSDKVPNSTETIAKLLREALTLESPVLTLKQRRIARWRKYLGDEFYFKDKRVAEVLDEFSK